MNLTKYIIATAVLISAIETAAAATVFSGYDISFNRVDEVDWTLEENQDRITENVWITRADRQGLFNIAPGQETSYDTANRTSPVGTRWAFGNADDYENLSFDSWEGWNGAHPPDMVGRDAVVHLVEDDIYLDIRFTQWGNGRAEARGSFSYVRADVAPIPVPGLALGFTFAVGLLLRSSARAA